MRLVKQGNIVKLDTSSIEVRQQRYLKHLSSALCHYLENPQGDELVFLLGTGNERNNREALYAWVNRQREAIFAKRLEGQSPLDYLISRIEQLLER